MAEIGEHQAQLKSEGGQKRVNKRGVLAVDGYTDFDPDANVQIDRKTHLAKQSSKEAKKGGKCCKSQ